MSTPTDGETMATADTQLQIFNLNRISATSLHSYGAPLVIRVESKHGDLELIVYTDNPLLSDLVASAINDAVLLAGGNKPEKPACPFEQAAYTAQDYAYQGGSR
jgi:hypothetical protein